MLGVRDTATARVRPSVTSGNMLKTELVEEPVSKTTTRKYIVLGCTYALVWLVSAPIWAGINMHMISTSKSPPLLLFFLNDAFCASLAALLVHCRVMEPMEMDRSAYVSFVLPYAVLTAGAEYLTFAALSSMNVSLISAMTPMCVFVIACWLGVEKYGHQHALIILAVSAGFAMAICDTRIFGEMVNSFIGDLISGGAVLLDSSRLVLLQKFLQSAGNRMSPIHTIYFTAPACCVALAIPFFWQELPQIMRNENFTIQPWWLLGSCVASFASNVSGFMLLQHTSALTMNVAIAAFTCLLAGIGMLFLLALKEPSNLMSTCGLALALPGVICYFYSRLQAVKAVANVALSSDIERAPLLVDDK